MNAKGAGGTRNAGCDRNRNGANALTGSIQNGSFEMSRGTAPASEAVWGYSVDDRLQGANDKMHKGMTIPYNGNAVKDRR